MNEILYNFWISLGTYLTLVTAVQGHFVQYNYKKVANDQLFNGTLEGRYAERSKIECSLRCSTDNLCLAYQFDNSTNENCGVIHGNSTEESRQQFRSKGNNVVFRKDLCGKGNGNTDSAICKNGGTCVDGISTYTCHCTEGFTGINCEDISACASNPCLNDGVCTESHDSYSCDCGSDYDGNRCQHECKGNWTVPDGWTGSQPVVYRNLDISMGLTFARGSENVPGKICNGVETDKTDFQYVNLGDLSEACITRPVTCGSDGGTVALWLKVENCGTNGGALSTSDYYYDGGPTPREGFIVSCFTTGMRYIFIYPNDGFRVTTARPTGWFHIVLTLQGNNLKIYHNKVVQGGSRQNWDGSDADGPSDTVIGSYFADDPQFFSSIIMDELAMWNRVLSEAEVSQIYDITFQ